MSEFVFTEPLAPDTPVEGAVINSQPGQFRDEVYLQVADGKGGAFWVTGVVGIEKN